MPPQYRAGYRLPVMPSMTFPMKFGDIVLVMLGKALSATLPSQLPHIVDAQPLVRIRADRTLGAAKNALTRRLPFVTLPVAEAIAGTGENVFRG